jgi:hypothetical protein
MNEWYYQNAVFDEDMVGKYTAMVYLITNLRSGRKYIGKKKFLFKKIKTVNKKKKRVFAPSDWQDYYGSSEELKKDVELLGKENFRREILHLCMTPGESSYLEIKEQIIQDALLRDDYYNAFVGCKVHRNHVKVLWQTIESTSQTTTSHA